MPRVLKVNIVYPMIVCKDLTKDYDSRRVVENVSFEVSAGSVTALVGRNGSGKSTTLRMLLGLTTPTTGTALIDGVPYRDLPSPARVVGAAITDVPGHPSLNVRAQLRSIARSLAVPATAVDDILGQVGLSDASSRKIGALSLGMRQRLSLGCGLLSSPRALILDEPANGLDPDGIRWLRTFLQSFAGAGGAVLVSSHSLDEIERTADGIVVLNRSVRYAGTISGLMADERGASLEEALHSVLDREAV